MQLPLVSVIVPCYNAAPWLRASLQSVLSQTWPHLEIIAVDDGSTDDTRAALEPFEARGVRVIRQRNAGASAARNRGLAEATGAFIQYLDADDLLAPDKIARQMNRLLAGPTNIVASCEWARFTDAVPEGDLPPQAVWHDLSPIDFLVTCALDELMFPPICWLIPKAVVDAAGPWNERLSLNDDGEYMSRVLAQSRGIAFVPGARAYYRSGNPASYASQKSDRAGQSELLAWDLTAATMLGLEESARVRRAVATGYQRIEAAWFFRNQAIVDDAAAKARAYGGGAYRFDGGPGFRLVRRVFGWKAALRLRHVAHRLRGAGDR